MRKLKRAEKLLKQLPKKEKPFKIYFDEAKADLENFQEIRVKFV